jgi:hypothetical protein
MSEWDKIQWDKILPLQMGEKVRIKSFSTYAPKYSKLLISEFKDRVGVVVYRFHNEIFVELKEKEYYSTCTDDRY